MTLGIQLMTMPGQAIHGGAAIHGLKEQSLAMVCPDLWTVLSKGISFHCTNVSIVQSVHVSSAHIILLRSILSQWLRARFT